MKCNKSKHCPKNAFSHTKNTLENKSYFFAKQINDLLTVLHLNWKKLRTMSCKLFKVYLFPEIDLHTTRKNVFCNKNNVLARGKAVWVQDARLRNIFSSQENKGYFLQRKINDLLTVWRPNWRNLRPTSCKLFEVLKNWVLLKKPLVVRARKTIKVGQSLLMFPITWGTRFASPSLSKLIFPKSPNFKNTEPYLRESHWCQ